MTGADTARPSVADFCGSVCGFACFAAKAESNATASATGSILHRCMSLPLNACRYDALTPSLCVDLPLPTSTLCQRSYEGNENQRTRLWYRCKKFRQLQDQHGNEASEESSL